MREYEINDYLGRMADEAERRERSRRVGNIDDTTAQKKKIFDDSFKHSFVKPIKESRNEDERNNQRNNDSFI